MRTGFLPLVELLTASDRQQSSLLLLLLLLGHGCSPLPNLPTRVVVAVAVQM
jgi:hypothetical protein